jgi:thiol-disulfide isomerase/thioredoxin
MKKITLVRLLLYVDAVFSFAYLLPLKHNLIIEKSCTTLNGLGVPTMVPAEEQDEEQSTFSLGGIKRHIKEKARLIQTLTRRSDLAITSIETIKEYKEVVVEESDRIVVVRFHATWCKSCRASEPHFLKLVSKYSTQTVKFVQVPLTQETGYLQNALGVPSVPFAHIYYPGAGLVEEMKLSKPHMQQFDDILNTYVQGFCTLPNDPVIAQPVIGAFQ